MTMVYGWFRWDCPEHGLMESIVDAGPMAPYVTSKPCWTVRKDGTSCGFVMRPEYVVAPPKASVPDGSDQGET